ncbi:hypothetical protein McpSp1_13760 [Methanocorpusculaceae archaeon Sp1]|uniref:Uncharacterized protein n=1 Tax=Methanorbis furvi TaxID=3028299 RepID=A0AAE4MBU9_9EURY|nr:hypothetical protein [Methanocorpusculaceae archaeon Sp1]MDV0441344.1 hypothetical protein [Methanocorpusculaceae archaeon Ag1]
MQVMESEGKPQKAMVTISVTPDVKETLRSLKRGNESYNDVLEPLLFTAAVHEKGDGIGAVFLDSVYMNDTLRKLKKPIPLKIVIDENGSLILANNEYSLLVVCDSLEDGLEEARWEFNSLSKVFQNPEIPDDAPAKQFGKKLQSVVWM